MKNILFFQTYTILFFVVSCHDTPKDVVKTATITIVNGSAVTMIFSIHASINKDSALTEGNFKLAPGEKKIFEWKFVNIVPSFAVYSRSSTIDAELIRWHFGLPSGHPGIHHYNGPDERKTFLREASDADFSFLAENNAKLPGNDKYLAVFVPLKFEPVTDTGNKFQSIYIIKDEEFPEVYEGVDSNDESWCAEVYSGKARDRYASLMKEFKKTATLVMKNTLPLDINYFLHYQFSQDSSETTGPFFLESGEEARHVVIFRGVETEFFVHAVTAVNESNMLGWLTQWNQGAPADIYFQGDEQSETIFKPITRNSFFKYGDSMELPAYDSNSTYMAGFAGYKAVEKNGEYEVRYILQDSLFEGIYKPEDIQQQNPETVFAAKAKLLHASLHRQYTFDKSHPNPQKDMPFHLGFAMDDDDPTMPGAIITNVCEKDIEGNNMPFRQGDILLAVNGEPVFSPMDALYMLIRHGSDINKGIEVPLDFRICRRGTNYDVRSFYFFNPDFPWPDENSDWDALFHGILHAITFGFDGKLVQFFSSNQKEAWQYIQTKKRLQSLNPGYFIFGDIGISFFFPGAYFLEKSLARRLARIGLSEAVALRASTATLMMAENVLWTIGSRNQLDTEVGLRRKFKESLLMNAGLSIATGSFIRRTDGINLQKQKL